MDFLKFYEEIDFDIGRRTLSKFKAKQGDSGRGFKISVGEGIKSLSLTAYFELPDGSKDDVLATKQGDYFMLQIPKEILKQAGNLKTEFVLENSTGDILAKEYFMIPVARSVRGVSE